MYFSAPLMSINEQFQKELLRSVTAHIILASGIKIASLRKTKLPTMKSASSLRSLIIALLFLLSHATSGQGNGQPSDPKLITQTILRMDSLFWLAYNTCDVEKMATFFTDDLEFYHDKGGLTTTVASLMETPKKESAEMRTGG
jgi:hypothetical protein